MSLHLQKLCVGVESFEDLESLIKKRLKAACDKAQSYEMVHQTRSMPKERDALLDGGSLYWVIKGVMEARQEILDLQMVIGEDGIKRCNIVLKPELIRTQPLPRRAFQGWRYLKIADTPADLEDHALGADKMPSAMRKELVALGLL